MKLYSVIDNGRLHLAKDTDYVGSVNSYNNCFTRFFARCLFLSEQVCVAGVVHHVNRRDYASWRSAHLAVPGEKITDLQHVIINISQASGEKGRMRDNITAQTSKKLFKSLIHSIKEGKSDQAKLLVGQGASLEKKIWLSVESTARAVSFGKGWEKLCKAGWGSAKHITALGYAKEKGLTELGEFFLTFGATQYCGDKVTFASNRKVVWVDEYSRPRYSSGIQTYEEWRTCPSERFRMNHPSGTRYRRQRYEWTTYSIANRTALSFKQ